jgi:hypothetical protein
MSWTDDELDSVFREASEQAVFDYKASYFQDIEKQLPIKKGRSISLFFWMANVFIVGFTAMIIAGNWSPTAADRFFHATINKGVLSAENNTGDGHNQVQSSMSRSTGSDNQSIKRTVKTNMSSTKNTKVSTEITVHRVGSELQETLVQPLASSQNLTDVFLKDAPLTKLFEDSAQVTSSGLIPLSLTEFECSAPSRTSDYLRPFRNKKNSFYVGLAAGAEQAWASEAGSLSALNSSVSLELGYRVPVRSFQFSTGFGVEITRLNDLRINERTKLYGFGSALLENSYQFSSIYSFVVPIEVSKSFGRHTIGAGIVGELNVLTHASHEKSIDGVNTMNASGLTNVALFNRFGLSPKLSYSLALSHKLQLGLSVQAQLIQPVNSDRFIGLPTHLPISGQLFLKRSLKF